MEKTEHIMVRHSRRSTREDQQTDHRTSESFGKKHEIAQVKAQLQAQVEVANLSRKHKNEMLKRIADAWPSLSQ